MTLNFTVKIKTGSRTRPSVTVRATALKQDQPISFASGFETTPRDLANLLAGNIDFYIQKLKK